MLCAYFSKRDSRVWVPRRPLGMQGKICDKYPRFSFLGTCINFGNPRGLLWCYLLWALPVMLMFGIMLLSLPGRK